MMASTRSLLQGSCATCISTESAHSADSIQNVYTDEQEYYIIDSNLNKYKNRVEQNGFNVTRRFNSIFCSYESGTSF